MSELRDVDDLIRWALLGLGVVFGLASLAVPTILTSTSKLRTLLEEEDRVAALAGHRFTVLITRLVLGETVAIFGLLLALLSGDPSQILPFAGASVVLIGMSYPSLNGLRNRLVRL